jgi:16S rRNA C1402 (ribose-2'-O) methylase RsmI
VALEQNTDLEHASLPEQSFAFALTLPDTKSKRTRRLRRSEAESATPARVTDLKKLDPP